jgi:hypothetical protein
METVMPASRDEFIRQLQAEFPEAAVAISEYETGILHCEVAVLRRLTEETMDAGNAWLAERHFRFIERLLKDANAELRNAIEVSYLEDLALGEHRAAAPDCEGANAAKLAESAYRSSRVVEITVGCNRR